MFGPLFLCNLPFAKSRSRPDRSQRKAKLHKRIVSTNYAVPTGNLDSASSREIMEILKGMHRSGETLILITHDNGIAAQARRVVRIMDGKIESDTINEEFVEEA